MKRPTPGRTASHPSARGGGNPDAKLSSPASHDSRFGLGSLVLSRSLTSFAASSLAARACRSATSVGFQRVNAAVPIEKEQQGAGGAPEALAQRARQTAAQTPLESASWRCLSNAERSSRRGLELEGRRTARRERLKFRRRSRSNLILTARRKFDIRRRHQAIADVVLSSRAHDGTMKNAAKAMHMAVPAGSERIMFRRRAVRRCRAISRESGFLGRRSPGVRNSRQEHLDAERTSEKQRHDGLFPRKISATAPEHAHSPFGDIECLAGPPMRQASIRQIPEIFIRPFPEVRNTFLRHPTAGRRGPRLTPRLRLGAMQRRDDPWSRAALSLPGERAYARKHDSVLPSD